MSKKKARGRQRRASKARRKAEMARGKKVVAKRREKVQSRHYESNENCKRCRASCGSSVVSHLRGAFSRDVSEGHEHGKFMEKVRSCCETIRNIRSGLLNGCVNE